MPISKTTEQAIDKFWLNLAHFNVSNCALKLTNKLDQLLHELKPRFNPHFKHNFN